MRHRCAGSRHPSIECLKSTRFIHDRQTMYSMLCHDLQGLTYIIAGSANGKLPAHDFAYQEIGCSSVLGCQRDEQIAIRNHPNHATTAFDNGERPTAFVPHLLTRRSRVRSGRARRHVLRHNLPNLHRSTPFCGFCCPAGQLATSFEAEGNRRGRLFETFDSLSGSGTIVVRSRRRTFTRAEIRLPAALNHSESFELRRSPMLGRFYSEPPFCTLLCAIAIPAGSVE